jgi:glycosyltransferase involved in cell wall biosynthesis
MSRKMNDLISIVIPTFNRSKFLERAIDSIFSQTYKNWELIVVDNSSTDDTRDMLKKFSGDKLSVFTVNNHGVIGYSRNIGIKKAKGRFIAFLDSDDWWTEDKLSRVIDALHKYRPDVIYHDCKIVSQNASFTSNCRRLSKNMLKDLVVNGNALITSSVVVTKTSLLEVGSFSEKSEISGWEDYHLWLRLAKSSCEFYKIDKNCGFYWQGDDNFDSPERALENLIKIENHLKDEYTSITNRYYVWWINYTKGRASLKDNNFKIAKEAFLKVIINEAPLLSKLKSLYWRLHILFRS